LGQEKPKNEFAYFKRFVYFTIEWAVFQGKQENSTKRRPWGKNKEKYVRFFQKRCLHFM